MDHRMLRTRAVKPCFTKPLCRSRFVAAHVANLPKQDRCARRLFLLLYYAVCAQCLAAAGVLNYCLLRGYGGNLKYHALVALLISMSVSIVCSTHYERKHRAAHQLMQRESRIRELKQQQ